MRQNEDSQEQLPWYMILRGCLIKATKNAKNKKMRKTAPLFDKCVPVLAIERRGSGFIGGVVNDNL